MASLSKHLLPAPAPCGYSLLAIMSTYQTSTGNQAKTSAQRKQAR